MFRRTSKPMLVALGILSEPGVQVIELQGWRAGDQPKYHVLLCYHTYTQ